MKDNKLFNKNIINEWTIKFALNVTKNFSEFKDCYSKRGSHPYHENKEQSSNKQKNFYEKNGDKLLQKQFNKHISLKELLISYVEL